MTTPPIDNSARYSARGCGSLISTVIQQAFHDVFAPASSYGNKELLRSEAMSFLTSSTGEWAAHRRFLCDLVGIDSDVLRRYVHEILIGHRDPILAIPGVEQRGQEVFNQKQVDAARAAYQQQFHYPKTVKPKPVETKPARTVSRPTETTSGVLKDWYANMADA